MIADLRAFPLDLRRRAIAAIRSVERRPEPDGVTRRELPVPFGQARWAHRSTACDSISSHSGRH